MSATGLNLNCEICFPKECTCPPYPCLWCRVRRGEVPEPEWSKRRRERLALRAMIREAQP